MHRYPQIAPIADSILKEYDLCDQCLGRLFSRQLGLSSNRLLGKKLNGEHDGRRRRHRQASRCHICKSLFDELDHLLGLMAAAASGTSFRTFSVGAILRPSVVDRDDAIRSRYRLRGVDSVKTDLTRELTKSFSRRTKKRPDPRDADVTFTINTKDGSCQMRSKSLFFSGRYVKSDRGLPQKQRPCPNCAGRGCRGCDFHGISGYDSVEGFVSRLLFDRIGGTSARFTWVGSEDRSSLVLGRGRPFFVKLCNPRRRHRIRPIYSKNSAVAVRNLKVIPALPPQPMAFHSKVDAVISAGTRITPSALRKARASLTPPLTVVVYDRSGRRTEKRISSVSVKRLSGHRLGLCIAAEGGLPIKRFVSGDDVVPSVSSALGSDCSVDEFDFMDIEVCGNDNS